MRPKKRLLVYALDPTRLGVTLFVLRTRGFCCTGVQILVAASLPELGEVEYDAVVLLLTHEGLAGAAHLLGNLREVWSARPAVEGLPPLPVQILVAASLPEHLDCMADVVLWKPTSELLVTRLRTLLQRKRGPRMVARPVAQEVAA